MTEPIRSPRSTSFPQGRGVRVEVGEHRIAVFRIGEDVYAIGDRCSHAEASLAEGEVFDTDVECPRHGSEFDLDDGQAGVAPGHPAGARVRHVEVDDGDVTSDLDRIDAGGMR